MSHIVTSQILCTVRSSKYDTSKCTETHSYQLSGMQLKRWKNTKEFMGIPPGAKSAFVLLPKLLPLHLAILIAAFIKVL